MRSASSTLRAPPAGPLARLARVAWLTGPAVASALAAAPARADDARPARALAPVEEERGTWFRVTTTLGAGIGLRFNNPYRLATPLGSNAESISRTAAYSDVGAGIAFGEPDGITHGLVLRWDHALQGVSQDVLTPSYALGRRWLAWELWGRVGVPILLRPDANAGGEAALGVAWFPVQGLGAWGELCGDLFFGTATPDQRRPVYPVLSLQLGAVFEWERLP